MTTHRSRGPRKAFTLMEMLVVIAIIAILASILIPTMSSSREKARTAYCANNLSQIGKALISYCDEHKEQLPGVNDADKSIWDTALLPYLGYATNLFFCPSDPLKMDRHDLRSYAAGGGHNNVAFSNYNPPFGGNNLAPPPLKMSSVDMNKGEMILIGERPGDAAEIGRRGIVGRREYAGMDQIITGIHKNRKGANFLMSSLSVQYYETNTIADNTSANYWNLKTN